jgi:trehalose/maltose hydrolase-like predicted phosphorylase
VVGLLADRGLEARIVSSRLNRRKIDLIPLPEWADPPKARLPELLAAVLARLSGAGFADLAQVVELARTASADCGLPNARITSDAKHVEIGLTDKSDSMATIAALLDAQGVGPGLVLVVGDEFGPLGGVPGSDSLLLIPEYARATAVSVGPEPRGVPLGVHHLGGGPPQFVELLEEQLERCRMARVPAIDDDPRWVVHAHSGNFLRQPVDETLLSLGAGGFVTRGSLEERSARSNPMVIAANVYEGEGPAQHLRPCPSWTSVDCDPAPTSDTRTLDLRTGVLHRQERASGRVGALRTARFASVARPGLMALRAEAEPGRLDPGEALRPVTASQPAPEPPSEPRRAGIATAATQKVCAIDSIETVERLAAYVRADHHTPAAAEAETFLASATAVGFDGLLGEHRAAWARRWDEVGICVPDDPDAELATRFALFHLWNNTDSRGELGVGARGLSGTGYSGHVFWDADVFVLPAVLTMDPGRARAMLRYRLRRLKAAIRLAHELGHDGARFPWESAADGTDVTPTVGRLGADEVPILTGLREEHITADVAWAAVLVSDWTGGHVPASVRELVIETARYWASRCERDSDGSVHIRRVIGPDEYHELVDDNAFTNVMARWNLRAAATLVEAHSVGNDETRRWMVLADALVDGFDPTTGIYEQFHGYHQLEPLTIGQFAEPPVAADLLLGRERIARSQIIKQADVLMLHHLVPDSVAPGSLRPNLDFYMPRTAHGSSLSPAVAAALTARAGQPDAALALLRLALRLDLDDVTRMTASGLHLATLGGVWQAVLGGFLGVRVRNGELLLDPVLPSEWGQVEVRFQSLGRHLRVVADTDSVEIHSDRPLDVRVSGELRRVQSTNRLPYSRESRRSTS